MTVSEIFDKLGEGHFRDGERRVIARLVGEGPAGDRDRRRGLLQRRDPRADPRQGDRGAGSTAISTTLVERVGAQGHRGPCCASGDPREIITALKAEREPFYAQAPIHVEERGRPAQRRPCSAS